MQLLPSFPAPRLVRRRRVSARVACVGALLVLAPSVLLQCSGEPAAGGEGAASTDVLALPEIIGFADTGAASDGVVWHSDAGPDVAGLDAVAPDVVAPDAPGTGVSSCEFTVDPAPGEAGSACAAPGDCDSSYCVDARGGKVCTRTCVECCPTGFACEVAPGADSVNICVPKLKALCRPCGADSGCDAISAGALCVGYGAAGSFCGGGCVADADCPAGFACAQSNGSQGSAKQCVRSTGACTCSAAATTAGASTACQLTNSFGTCTGTRKCAAAGLTDCDATTPAAEVCNGVDDDCDGETDEGLAGLACESSAPAGTCQGVTTCASGVAGCTAPTPTAETCNGLDDDCDGVTDEGQPDLDKDGQADCVDPDIDGDGTPNAADCGPLDLAVSPSATEVCNGKDDDCDGETDEAGASGCVVRYVDADKDGFGAGTTAAAGSCLCKATGDWTATLSGDCADDNKAVFPGAKEQCNDVDDDCDGVVDEGCDDDGDGWCDKTMVAVGLPKVCTQGLADCDDAAAAVSPGAKEQCGNQIDDDCDGTTDSGLNAVSCAQFYIDADKDGAGGKATQCLCAAAGLYQASTATDCDDGDAAVNPAATEICGNQQDDNCDGSQDEPDAKGCVAHWHDGDKDGFGGGKPACLCGPSATHGATKGGDCADTDASVAPNAKESCNGKDDNCDGKTDEQDAQGCLAYYVDVDGDGFGTKASKPGNSACLCAPLKPWTVTLSGDCDDADKAIGPGGKEVCNSKDDDCDGATDEADAGGCAEWYVDGDKDGWGVTASKLCLCGKSATHNVTKGGDCQDGDAAISPAAAETCNAKDDDCDGKIDEVGASGCTPWFYDGDVDGWGKLTDSQCLCAAKAPYLSAKPGDCDDTKAGVKPGATESCNALDDDCDGSTDEAGAKGCAVYFADSDQDGYGNPLAGSQCLCAAKAPFVALQAGDCNDADKTIHTGAAEQCNGKDDDCDGVTDEIGAKGCKVWYLDTDQDGYGLTQLSQCLCAAATPFTASKPGDCNDGDKAIHPAAKELCNSKDDDCNGSTDEGEGNLVFYFDDDNDGFGTAASAKLCKPLGLYRASKAGDCKDTDKAVFPGNPEVCDGKDNDCDGQTDNNAKDAKVWFLDTDKDGWGVTGASKLLCSAATPYVASKAGDCADGDAAVNPGQTEIQCNKKDDDCKGGDACTQCAGVCGGKCGSSAQQTTTKLVCYIIFDFKICQNEPVACYCDAACVGFGDCCPGRATCCQ